MLRSPAATGHGPRRPPVRFAQQVKETLPRLDVLVNNVGGYWNHRHLDADAGPRRGTRIKDELDTSSSWTW